MTEVTRRVPLIIGVLGQTVVGQVWRRICKSRGIVEESTSRDRTKEQQHEVGKVKLAYLQPKHPLATKTSTLILFEEM